MDLKHILRRRPLLPWCSRSWGECACTPPSSSLNCAKSDTALRNAGSCGGMTIDSGFTSSLHSALDWSRRQRSATPLIHPAVSFASRGRHTPVDSCCAKL
jgi:hypothetical protein